MNIVNKVTIRQLKLNKKRTLVTIIGAIISVAMITAVATLGLSFMDFMKRQEIADNGEWHVRYRNVNQEQLRAIEEDKETNDLIISRDVGYALLEGSQNKNKPYLFIKEMNQKGYEKYPIELIEGRLPEQPDELVISDEVLLNAKVDYKVGDLITLSIGERFQNNEEENNLPLLQNSSLQRDEGGLQEYLTKDSTNTYHIVGMIERSIWEYTWSPGYTVLSYVDESNVTSDQLVNVTVVMKHVNNSLFLYTEGLASKLGIDKVDYNNSLLRYSGVVKDDGTRTVLYTLSAIIMGIIMIGSISLIYNAFAISVSERSRYLGMLSSVGATKRQKRNSVFFEGAIIGGISIPIGIIAGYVGLGITFLCINPMIQGAMGATVGLLLTIYPSSIIVAVVVSAVTIFISTYIPARRASNISAIEAIRQTADVKYTRKSVKTTSLTRKIFGMEGDLGLKNLKRNKGRYKATVFSLIISMVLFLVVSFFTTSLKKSIVMTQEGFNYDIRVSVNGEDEEENKKIIERIVRLEDITEITQIKSYMEASTWINEDSMADYLKLYQNEDLEDGKFPYFVTINALDDKAIKNYADEIGVDFSLLKDEDNVNAIVIDTVIYQDYEIEKYIEAKNVKAKVGDVLGLAYYKEEEEQSLGSAKIVALTNKMPMGIMSLGNRAAFHIIISEDSFAHIMNYEEAGQNRIRFNSYLKSDHPLRLQENLEAIQSAEEMDKLNIYNYYRYRQQDEQMILLMSVFTYAFIILITAICVANIMNTISTSIALRKREFAMLKSVGITPKGFNKMLNYESIFYGIKALLYGIPISIGVMYLIHRTLMKEFSYTFSIPWVSMTIAVTSVFVIVGVAMLYSSTKVKKENIIDALKEEII